MGLLAIVVGSAVLLTIAYFTYGRLLARLFHLTMEAQHLLYRCGMTSITRRATMPHC